MAKQPPEKLAAALRANLLRRKQGPAGRSASQPQSGPSESPKKPPKNSA